ncbi:DNA polymerase III subunit epsilon [Massilia antarctica]|uniref:DNA polymerase III subunit epsilon n=1 Tax=Massilia antarctica TaxID=2765360 RepID=UPI0006BB7E33|nr:DNA polymerase III subunit epsilon [Massilia sp. H27-R4]MCY0910244.1 DNA polymerase III subunit epsilon [Massilia sp. H27-R4]CUI09413.1 DNA polymerase III epsilon subunit [Janthinobacterium sp. CG23_2]CUU33199.1 DNA polymerase III epsilon subunit [Janthinobacterium sp. CG23_2]
MRQIVLDTETTGLNPRTGDRVIEVGCVELVNRMLTGNNFHRYINPDRDSEEGALAVHGLTTEFLRDKPRFAEIAQELREYIQGAEVIIHNAPFDLGFLNNEFKLLGLPSFTEHCSGVIDTLVNAKEMHPGKRNSLDALCDRYGVSNAHRKLHGALLDAELLADVYLSMTRGQNSLSMDVEDESAGGGGTLEAVALAEVIVLAASADELAEHDSVLGGLDKAVKGNCIWRNYAEA